MIRLSPNTATILGSYNVAGWALSSSYDGSMQGVTFDTSDNSLWAVLEATCGGAPYLRTKVLIGTPVALPAAANGIAHYASCDLLLILLDAAPTTIRVFNKAGANLSGNYQMLTLPSNETDHRLDPGSGKLLASWGANGVASMIGWYGYANYGGWASLGVDTLAGADAIKGIVAFGDSHYFVNGAATHPDTLVANRLLRYRH